MRISLSILLLIVATGIFSVAQEPDIEEPTRPSKTARAAKPVAKPKPLLVKSEVKPEPRPQPKAVQSIVSETKPQAPATQPVKVETKTETPVAAPVQAPPMGEDDRLDFMRTEEVEQPREPSSSGLIIKSVGALALVIALLFAGTWTLRKLGFGGKKPTVAADQMNLAVVSSIAMGGGRTISTLQFGNRVLLVGSTAQSFTLLAEETPFGTDFSARPRSVADILAGDDRTFEDELAFMTDKWEARERYQ